MDVSAGRRAAESSRRRLRPSESHPSLIELSRTSVAGCCQTSFAFGAARDRSTLRIVRSLVLGCLCATDGVLSLHNDASYRILTACVVTAASM